MILVLHWLLLLFLYFTFPSWCPLQFLRVSPSNLLTWGKNRLQLLPPSRWFRNPCFNSSFLPQSLLWSIISHSQMKLSLGCSSLMSNNESTDESIMAVRDKYNFWWSCQIYLTQCSIPFCGINKLSHSTSSLFIFTI